MKHTHKIFSLRYIIYSLTIILSAATFTLVYALGTIDTGFRTTSTAVMIDAHNECRTVRHTGSNEYFVPTRTAAEWLAFRQNAPSDVMFDECRYPGCDTDDITIGAFTIAACNVGATTASTNWTVSRGQYFQWGRNKGFAFGDTSQQATTIAGSIGLNASTDTNGFVWNNALPSPYTWANTDISNNWGHTTNTNIARQGPCAPGYRVPSVTDWQNLVSAGGWGNNGAAMQTALQLPYAGYRHWSNGSWNLGGSFGIYWSSSPSGTNGHYLHFNSSTIYPPNSINRVLGFPVRCFKN